MEIIPAILTNDKQELEEKMARLAGLVKRVQIDIIDGVFSDNKTVLPDALGSIETELLIDFQLMTKEPIDWIEHCVRGMAERIFGQIEMMSSQEEFVGKVQEVGAKVGLALDLDTPIERLDTVILTNIDAVLLMSVKAGFGGQNFDPHIISKIKALDEIRVRDNTPFVICVDGGINEANIKEVRQAGADEVAIGRRLFAGDVEENLKRLLGS
ncbi:hypothetical protein HY404_02860 [Candidatus Microgenomates bacterium]|nr:hypothetical protein [Candidatus Microgenomates bacterium]